MSEESDFNFVDFNQDYTSLSVGSRSGYSLLSTENDEVIETYAIKGDPMGIVGRLFTSNLVTLVSVNDPRKLLIFHSRRDSLICDYRYTSTILAVKMNRQRLIVCLENEIFIHNIRDMELLHRIEETPNNRYGVIAFSARPEKSLLAYPGSNRVGTVYIFDALNFTNVASIAAHDSPLAVLSFNFDSTLLATASERGTLVRVFSVPNGDKLMEFRRGLARCVSICSLNFSLDNRFLVCASNTETVHVFKLHGQQSAAGGRSDDGLPSSGPNEDTHHTATATGPASAPSGTDDSAGQAATTGSWAGSLVSWVGGALKAGVSYLPTPVSEVFSQDRTFAFARLPTAATATGAAAAGGHMTSPGPGDASDNCVPESVGSGCKKTAAIIGHGDKCRLLVAGLDGYIHCFSFDAINGGEAVLTRTQRLKEIPSANPTSWPSESTPDIVPPSDSRVVNPQMLHRPMDGAVSGNTASPRSFASVAATNMEPPSSQPMPVQASPQQQQ